jgi:hypothetical protein
MPNHTCCRRNNVYLKFNYRRFYLISLLIILTGILMDYTSTFFLLRDYPHKVRETNYAIRELVEEYGPIGVFWSWTRLTASYVMVGLMGSLLLYMWFTSVLPIPFLHRLWVTIALGMQLMVFFVHGAGISNWILYLLLRLGWV